MRMFEKTTAFFLAFLFAFSPVAGGFLNRIAFAEDEFIESPILPINPSDPIENPGLVYRFNEEKGTASVIDFTDGAATFVLIPDQVEEGGKSYVVDRIDTVAFSACFALKDIVIPRSVTEIASFAFDACTNLEEVWFEGDKASSEAISVAEGNEAFAAAVKHYGACMESSGPDDFLHVYDGPSDGDCNACGECRSFAENFTAGDLDGNSDVDVDDAIYLLFFISFPERYPVNQAVDYDGNGVVDVDDVFYLLYHVSFPERYPI